jgi:hypothetical protein
MIKMKDKKNIPACCNKKENKSSGFLQGLIYGTIPHIGCIAFILLSVLGVTFAASIFKPLLAKAYFFYAMILLSLIFALISAFFYLKKQGGLSTAKNHKGYLSILLGTTLGISLIMYFFIFPMIAGVSASTGISSEKDKMIILKVNIPCEGHAQLITEELKTIEGVNEIKFSSPNIFNVYYDSSKTSVDKILSLEIFNEYKANKIN